MRGIYQWSPSQRASNAENVSIWWRHPGMDDTVAVITGPVTSGFPSQRASNVELCCYPCLLLVTVQSEVNTGWKRAPDYLRLYLANQPWACMNRWHHCRTSHDYYVMTWKHLALLMTLCEGIPLMKCQECGTLIFSLLLAWISCSTNNHVPANLRHLITHVMSL